MFSDVELHFRKENFTHLLIIDLVSPLGLFFLELEKKIEKRMRIILL